jgi:hypothetical protein
MKTIKLITCLVTLFTFLFIVSCKKTKLKGSYEPLVGEWIWISSTGGESGNTTTPATEGYTYKIELLKNGSYIKKKNDSKVGAGKIIINSNYIEFLSSNFSCRKSNEKEKYLIQNNILILTSLGSDKTGATYLKK